MRAHAHSLFFRHDRSLLSSVLDSPDVESTVEVESTSTDLTEAWRELLSRLPSDVYQALREAMPES